MLIAGSILTASPGKIKFEDHFTNVTMRIDYHHIWDGSKELISLDRIYKEGEWAGSRNVLLDPFKYGKYSIKLYTEDGKKLLFSKGFDSYFGEYITTDDASKGIKRSYHETALMPYPVSKSLFKIEKISPNENSITLFSKVIDPGSVNIIIGKPEKNIEVIKVHGDGKPGVCLDIAIVAEGYTDSEEDKVKKDLNKVKDIFFSQEPYSSLKHKINIYGIFKPSDENGTDEPRIGSFKNTSVDTTFNSMGSPRYLLTESNKKLRDITSAAPCDAVLIMVNSSRYGGGGIYNSFCTFTIDNEQAAYLILHEFGHSFSGLADEYYSSSVAYNEFYPRGTEPVEPNITALLKPGKIKWSDHVSDGTKLPTDWNKNEFDRMNAKFGKTRKKLNLKIEELTRSGAPEKEIKKAKRAIELLMLRKEKENSNFFGKTGKLGVVGAFEGAGYSSEGLYRPMQDCIMFTIGKKPYCKVCEQAVEKMIRKYID
ncbi:MAG: peptidase M64 [Candidatus Aminicenantes bacterium]|nr:peptidase M64 [Candidatus Aminicenantes bacterium]